MLVQCITLVHRIVDKNSLPLFKVYRLLNALDVSSHIPKILRRIISPDLSKKRCEIRLRLIPARIVVKGLPKQLHSCTDVVTVVVRRHYMAM